jgi:hypothetical protein
VGPIANFVGRSGRFNTVLLVCQIHEQALTIMDGVLKYSKEWNALEGQTYDADAHLGGAGE